jgi:hypothetical protein
MILCNFRPPRREEEKDEKHQNEGSFKYLWRARTGVDVGECKEVSEMEGKEDWVEFEECRQR